LKNYVAAAIVMANTTWKKTGTGNVLITKADQTDFIGITVGRVLEFKLNCQPNGNYLNLDYGSLEDAKFQFHLGRPLEAAFADDFDRAVEHLEKLQDKAASSPNHYHM
ncbi:hypothetical protein BV22DRAFT_966752, partial [Leucogyrophana mollusca]